VTVVDDSEVFVALMSEVLGERFQVTGLQPRTVADLSETDPVLVFVDLFARDDGVLRGWELIEQARQDPRLRYVPMILCTGDRAAGEDRARLAALPDVHLLAKPFALNELESTMRRAMAAGSA
jgi:CheY-like chemotaxis protein